MLLIHLWRHELRRTYTVDTSYQSPHTSVPVSQHTTSSQTTTTIHTHCLISSFSRFVTQVKHDRELTLSALLSSDEQINERTNEANEQPKNVMPSMTLSVNACLEVRYSNMPSWG